MPPFHLTISPLAPTSALLLLRGIVDHASSNFVHAPASYCSRVIKFCSRTSLSLLACHQILITREVKKLARHQILFTHQLILARVSSNFDHARGKKHRASSKFDHTSSKFDHVRGKKPRVSSKFDHMRAKKHLASSKFDHRRRFEPVT